MAEQSNDTKKEIALANARIPPEKPVSMGLLKAGRVPPQAPVQMVQVKESQDVIAAPENQAMQPTENTPSTAPQDNSKTSE